MKQEKIFDAEKQIMFVEYGCGKAGLSEFVSIGLEKEELSKYKFLAVDRLSFNKGKNHDKKIRQRGFEITR